MNTLYRPLFYWFVICITLPFLLVRTIFAAGEFQADYDVQYAISPSGNTIVTQTVQLTNKLANYYPKQYSLLLDSDKISNVIAYDDGGVITPVISVKDGKTDIVLVFNAKTIGLGKSSTFSLRYEHAGVASKNGNIWEVYIPGITNDSDIGTYDVTLSVPPTFGAAAYVSPRPSYDSVWTKDQMIQGGIAAAYGSEQYFDVSLKYALRNSTVTPKSLGLALPPDTAFQKVTIQQLNPKPETVERDGDGNWIAYYNVLPAQSLPVDAKLHITTYLHPRKDFIGDTPSIPVYTKEREYWETSHPDIQALSKTHNTPEAIYRYVSQTLSYDYSRVDAPSERLGAGSTIDSPERAVCTEFTDLFVALSRAAGIPARRNVGYAYTNNPKLRPLSFAKDVLHAWPEYYDNERGSWIPVDPTWANTTGGADYFTKLDFNHIVFAINGLDSTLPYPAGFYREPDTTSKDVNVEFAQSETTASPQNISARIDFPQQVATGTTAEGDIIVTNNGGESVYIVTVDAESDIGDIFIREVIDELLPYATKRVPIIAHIPQSLSVQSGTIRATVNDATVTTTFSVRPLKILYGIVVAVGIAIALLVVYIIRTFVWKRSKRQ